MKKIIYIIIGLSTMLMLSNKAEAQFEYEQLPSISIGIGYFGELLLHPGFNLNSEFALNKAEVQLLARLKLANYKHKYYTKNWMFIQELVLRKNTKNFNYWETALGTTYIHQRPDATAYEYNNTEIIENNDGVLSIAPTLGIRYGYTIILPNGNIFAPNIGGRIFYQYPFNDVDLFRAAIDVSASYKIK